MTLEHWAILIGFLGLIGGGVAAYVKLIERITRIETFIATFSDKAADILHSPHTPDLDDLLEKYRARHYELTFAEWERLRVLCAETASCKDTPKGERSLAAWLETIAIHKLSPK